MAYLFIKAQLASAGLEKPVKEIILHSTLQLLQNLFLLRVPLKLWSLMNYLNAMYASPNI